MIKMRIYYHNGVNGDWRDHDEDLVVFLYDNGLIQEYYSHHGSVYGQYIFVGHTMQLEEDCEDFEAWTKKLSIPVLIGIAEYERRNHASTKDITPPPRAADQNGAGL
jgi:hypothetical protein